MVNKEKMRYYLPIILFFFMLIDAHLTRIITEWNHEVYLASAHLVVLAFLFCTISFSKRYLVITALILGTLYDLYYVGVIGIYAVALPVSVLLMIGLKPLIHKNKLTEFFSMVIFITGIELFTLIIQLVFKLATVDVNFFISRFLGPTLLLNMILFVIFLFPFKKLFIFE